MLKGLMGESSLAHALRGELDASSRRVRVAAHRVANATTPGATGFAAALDGQLGAATGEVDLEAEMVKLADEQLRYEASTRLLQKVYAQLRSSVRGG